MIYIDALERRENVAYAGPINCHMISDQDRDELREFAALIGMPQHWLRYLVLPHFDLSPNWRRRALAKGAIDCARDPARFKAAISRYCATNPHIPERVE
jgi:hypothetical protein